MSEIQQANETKTPFFFTTSAPPIMVFDVESIGLHGEAFAFGYVVIEHGNTIESGRWSCPTRSASGSDQGRSWVEENTPIFPTNCENPVQLCNEFWSRWKIWKEKGAMLAADCAWPVEARFLARCVDLNPKDREWGGPYPMLEISSFLLAANLNPMADYPRLENELPKHCPLADARQSARLLLDALRIISFPPKQIPQVLSQKQFWMCPACNHVMTEEQSKGYKGCPTGVHAVQHVPYSI